METYDIVVYGGTSGGVAGAIQGARMGKRVALIEPGKHLGGMTSGGLGWVDVGDPRTVGGIAHEYFHRVWEHYQRDANWTWEKKRPMKGQHPPLPEGDQTMWIVEPTVAERLFEDMAREAGVTVIRNERLNRSTGVKKDEQRIVSITMESGRTFASKMFIDATYEGDLMASAGVSYVVGREPNARYKETINGVRAEPAAGRLSEKMDPYVVSGDRSSGLLPRVHAQHGEFGAGDGGVQAYNYRLCLTTVPENRIPIEKPQGYDEKEYEILFRFLEAGGPRDKFIKLDRIPDGKTDVNNNGYVSTDYVGMSHDYPEADYATRDKIALAHRRYQQGFIWTLQHHPRVPEETRKFYAPWGFAKDEFTDTDHWPHQLYVREARRMVGDVIVTEHTAMGKDPAADPVGLGSYHMDSHAIKHFVGKDGFISSEGGMFVHIPSPYGVSYRAIVPKRGECENLFVPVCASATHAAYGSMRMEPAFMVLAQSAATAASLAIDQNVSVQHVPYDSLRTRLLADKQIIEWKVAPSH